MFKLFKYIPLKTIVEKNEQKITEAKQKESLAKLKDYANSLPFPSTTRDLIQNIRLLSHFLHNNIEPDKDKSRTFSFTGSLVIHVIEPYVERIYLHTSNELLNESITIGVNGITGWYECNRESISDIKTKSIIWGNILLTINK